MIERLIIIFIGALTTAFLWFDATLLQVLIPYGNWANAITFLPLLLGIVMSFFMKKKKDKDGEQPSIVTISIGAESVKTIDLIPGDCHSLGSDDSDSIIMKMPFINKNQLSICVKSGFCYVCDNNSKFPCHLNRQRMQRNKEYKAYVGDNIQLGKIKLRFLTKGENKNADL